MNLKRRIVIFILPEYPGKNFREECYNHGSNSETFIEIVR